MRLSLFRLLLTGMLTIPPIANAQSSLVATSPGLFEYHSAIWVNLHHFLYEQARGRQGLDTARAIVQVAVADTDGIGLVGQRERADWDRALQFYIDRLAGHDVLDHDMAGIKAALGDQGNAPTLAGAQIGDSLRSVLERAAPAYRQIWWPRHDASNRRWIAMMRPSVAEHGTSIANALTHAFNTPWPGFVIRVDASAYANWAGAYATVYPDRITVATFDKDYQDIGGLEMLFHESLHTLDDSVRTALRQAADRRGTRLSGDFAHALIFFTAGDITRRELPGYEPYAFRIGIWMRGSYPSYLPVLRKFWGPFLDGRLAFSAAIDSIAAAFPRREGFRLPRRTARTNHPPNTCQTPAPIAGLAAVSFRMRGIEVEPAD